MNMLAKAVTFGCFVWILSFVLLYGFRDGQAWLNELSTATGLFNYLLFHDEDDSKGRLPILFLALPILLAGTVCSSLTLATNNNPEDIISSFLRDESSKQNRRLVATIQRLPRRVQVIVYLFQQCCCCENRGGDVNFDFLSFVFLLVPLSVYLLSSIHRKLFSISESEPSLSSSSSTSSSNSSIGSNDVIAKVSNSFGMTALLAMSIFLIPATRHGAILQVIGWNPAAAIRLHIWAGRIVVFGGILHGSSYLFLGSSWWRVLLRPRCWTLQRGYVMDRAGSRDESSMIQQTTGCEEMDSMSCFSCDNYFRNWTGFLAAAGLLVIAISSLNTVRRRWYAIFYRIHILAGPLVFVMVILHYPRAILYLAGGILYYLASRLPVVVENQWSIRQDGGVRLLSVECIQDESELETSKPISLRQRPCVSLTFEASAQALDRYRAGQYVKLIAPSISFISHPFTINPVPGYDDRLQVIFRAVGPFTSELAEAVLSPNRRVGGTPISIGLEGFHGSPFRIRQVLQHDRVVVVAGGIGITPYLSLLHKIRDAVTKRYHVHMKKKIVLYWICRDHGLIEYTKRVYFDPLLTNGTLTSSRTNPPLQISIVIHRTTCSSSPSNTTSSPSQSAHPDLGKSPYQDTPLHGEVLVCAAAGCCGSPFHPSKFAAASKNSFRENGPAALCFVSITWIALAIILCFYSKQRHERQSLLLLLMRIWSLVLVLALTAFVAVGVNALYRTTILRDNDDLTLKPTWTASDNRQDETHSCLEMGETQRLVHERTLRVRRRDGDCDDTCPRINHLMTETMENHCPCRGFAVTLEERQGRPQVAHMLQCLDQARQPALFACGPPNLVDELEQTIFEERHCSNWDPRRLIARPGRTRISFYKESFCM